MQTPFLFLLLSHVEGKLKSSQLLKRLKLFKRFLLIGEYPLISQNFLHPEDLQKQTKTLSLFHPVRAHHHDEPPSTALAHLVIVANAISGSRPDTPRFTEDSYNQKMLNLERIIESFPHIADAYIMSAGREMRIIVNNKKVNDKEA